MERRRKKEKLLQHKKWKDTKYQKKYQYPLTISSLYIKAANNVSRVVVFILFFLLVDFYGHCLIQIKMMMMTNCTRITGERFEAIDSVWIRRVCVSHRTHFLDVGSFVDGTAQPRLPCRIVLDVDAFAIASSLLGPLLYVRRPQSTKPHRYRLLISTILTKIIQH